MIVNGCRRLAGLSLAVMVSACSGAADGDAMQSGGGAANGGGGLGQGGKLEGPRVCEIEPPTGDDCPDPPVYADVAPILEQRCFQCHGGLTGQTEWPLTTYPHVASWRDSLRSVLVRCLMPPVDSGLDIPEAESLVILNWLRCGMPL